MRDDGLMLAFGFGTFHAVVLTLVLLLPLYLTTDLGEALAELNTAAGLAVFAALWATSVYCTRRALLQAGSERRDGMPAPLLSNGIVWGGWNGVLFFWCLFVAGVLALLVIRIGEDGLGQVAGILVFGITAWGVGTVLSAIVGGAVGFVFALLDMLLLATGRWVAEESPIK